MRNIVFISSILVLAVFAVTTPAVAQFNPGPNPVTGTVGAQTLPNGTGTVNSGGAIRIASGSGVPLTMTGTSTLINNGTIQTLGTGRAIDSNSGTANLTITNTGLISSVSSDAFRVNTDSTVSLTNSGTIQVTGGGQAIDWAAITSKSNTLTNESTGFITAVGEDAVRPGTNGVVINAGTISATPTGGTSPTGSDGIDLRTFTGIQVTNSGLIQGRHGIATDGGNTGPSTLVVTNNADGTIKALNGSGINIDGVSVDVTANVTNAFGAVIQGGVIAGALEADGDGIDVDGVLTLNNSGLVLGLGARAGANNAEGIAAGGGSITNTATGQIIGSTSLADAPNGDPSRAGNGILIDNSNGGNAIAATTVTNSGLIEGKTGFGIKIIGTFDDTITNNAGGTIRGASVDAAIQTGGGADALTNRGAIVGQNGKAIDLGDGNDLLIVAGGAASILGDITGGTGMNTLDFDLGVGNTFLFTDSISLFGHVNILSGEVTFSGVSDYTGITRIASGGTLRLDDLDALPGFNLLSSGSLLDLAGGLLDLDSEFGEYRQTFSSFSLSGSSMIDLGNSLLTFNDLGTIGGSSTLSILNYAHSLDGYAFRVFGDRSVDSAFLALLGGTTINGLAAGFRTDGEYTYVAPLADLQAVPEPSTLVLVALTGVSGLLWRRRKVTKRPAGSRE